MKDIKNAMPGRKILFYTLAEKFPEFRDICKMGNAVVLILNVNGKTYFSAPGIRAYNDCSVIEWIAICGQRIAGIESQQENDAAWSNFAFHAAAHVRREAQTTRN